MLTTPYSATFNVGDGETKQFPYLFDEVSENFISVMVYNTSTGITTTPTYIIDTDQKQIIFGDDTPAPTADEVVCIYRNTPEVQDVSFRTLQGYDAKSLENILSKIVAMIQELKSNYFSTQVLQGDPWQLDLLSSADDGATVNIDYVAKKLVKGLYFRITSGNLQVSADGSNYITMPKSSDVAEFRQNQIELPDHTYQYKLQYRVGSTWYDADVTAQNTADAAYQLAETVQNDLSAHVNNLLNPHQTSVDKLADTEITNPADGQFLKFNGLKWVNSTSSATVNWGGIGGNLANQSDLKNALDAKVNIDGTSIMTAPLKFMSGSVRGAVGPYFNGVGFWKLDSQGNLTQIASISDSQFIPTTTNAIDIGNSTKKWKDLYLGGKAYVATINNGYDISVPAYAGTILVADYTGVTAGQMLVLDNDLKPVWQTITFTTSLSGLTDVTLSSPSNGDVLTYNGSKWVNQPASTPTINYSINGGNFVAGSGTYALSRFCLMLQKADGTWEKPTDTSVTYSEATNKTVNTNGFLLNQILYYNNTGSNSSGQVTGLNKVYSKHSNVPMSYSTNCGTAPGWTLGTYFYLVGTLGADGLFYLDTTQWWATALPNTNDGKLYIRLGPVSSSTSSTIALLEDRPIFYHDGTGIKEYHPVDRNIANWSSNVTNCITEIPQDINLELNNGTLTLKAGSKVYVPNGDGVFNEVTIASDISKTGWQQKRLLFYGNNILDGLPLEYCYSGSSAPSGNQYMLWYDTANNLVKYTSDSGSTWTSGYSLPIGITGSDGSSITSIDQIFNGFGYIGSTVFALPGVKGLIPDGRNADGTLKNIAFTINTILTTTLDNNYLDYNTTYYSISGGNPHLILDTELPYYIQANKVGRSGNAAIIGNFIYDKSTLKITSFTSKTVFHAVDYDTEFIAHQAMPSNKYVNLTAGATGSTYSMPADGYIYFNGRSTSQYANIGLISKSNNNATLVSFNNYCQYANSYMSITIPVSKGQTVQISYFDTDTLQLRFVYANGAA